MQGDVGTRQLAVAEWRALRVDAHHDHGSSLRQDRQRVAHRARRLPARIPRDENPLGESVEWPAVRHDQGRPPGREHHLLGRTMADVGWLIGVRLAQYDKISVAGVHAQHARDRRVERVVSPGLVGDAAALCSLPKALEGGLGLPLRLGIHGRLDVPRNVPPDVVQQGDLHDRIDAREMGAVLPRQADGGIDALPRSPCCRRDARAGPCRPSPPPFAVPANAAREPLQSSSLSSYTSAA